ncbi:MAG: RNA pseudouridine synthase [Puniceicoccales bacterium]|jgi:23S rRNA-/tRNA-specific pseudouridylate synthase|nr:RNA pseudouridine synthase [Puniceicoccales bacterium]
MNSLWQHFLYPKVHIVHSDENHVAALYKPCDILSVPNENGKNSKNILLQSPYDFERRCYTLPNGQNFFLLNRLDAPTSGLLIGCFDEEIARAIRECFFKQEVQKTYYALTTYQKIPPSGMFSDVLEKRRSGTHLRVTRGSDEKALTKYFVEEKLSFGGIPLLKLCLQPITGRTHQLRVQCALRKLPIIGDKTYGDFALNRKLWAILPEKRLYLQSCAIEFEYNFRGKKYLFSVKMPGEF